MECSKVEMVIGKRVHAMRHVYSPKPWRRQALCAMRDVEATMPAIASLEDLKVGPRDYRSMFLAITPDDLRLTIYD